MAIPLANGSTTTLTTTYASYDYTNDMYVIKTDAGGGALWAQRFGGSGTESGFGIGVDASGNSYVSGYFMGAMDVPLANGSTVILVPGGSGDAFVLKIDAAGAVLWAEQFGGAGYDYDLGLPWPPAGPRAPWEVSMAPWM